MAEKAIGGYAGKMLRVNLSTNTTSVEELDEKFCRKYIGGAGFIAYYLYKELKPGIDPLGPENKLIFALGPMTGLTLAGNSRNCVGAKSPLTGGIVNVRYLANLDSIGKGIKGRVKVGRKIAYPVKELIAWLESRSETLD